MSDENAHFKFGLELIKITETSGIDVCIIIDQALEEQLKIIDGFADGNQDFKKYAMSGFCELKNEILLLKK